MKNKQNSKSTITQEDIQKRLEMASASDELKKIRKDMETSPLTFTESSSEAIPLESLSGVGQSDEQVYKDTCKVLSEFLEKVSEVYFCRELKSRYFHNSKIVTLVKWLKSARLEMEARSMMDIFKDRVKQKNAGKMPVLKIKASMFGKATERIMKVEEIAKKFELEDDLPADSVKPINGVHGTKNGLLRHLQALLLENEEVTDPIKKNPRKSVGLFLKAAGLIKTETDDPKEKVFLACFFTPDSIQPKSKTDKENLTKLRSILNKGISYLNAKLNARETAQKQEAPNQAHA